MEKFLTIAKWVGNEKWNECHHAMISLDVLSLSLKISGPICQISNIITLWKDLFYQSHWYTIAVKHVIVDMDHASKIQIRDLGDNKPIYAAEKREFLGCSSTRHKSLEFWHFFEWWTLKIVFEKTCFFLLLFKICNMNIHINYQNIKLRCTVKEWGLWKRHLCSSTLLCTVFAKPKWILAWGSRSCFLSNVYSHLVWQMIFLFASCAQTAFLVERQMYHQFSNQSLDWKTWQLFLQYEQTNETWLGEDALVFILLLSFCRCVKLLLLTASCS